MKNKYLYLFSCCALVKGSKQSIICDFQRKNHEIIPNTLYELLINLDKERDINKLKSKYTDDEEKTIFDSYISFLIEKEFVFLDDILHDRFLPINFSFDSSNIISNSIIAYNKKTKPFIENIIITLDKLRCEAVEIRFEDDFFIQDYQEVLHLFEYSGIRSIKIITNNFNFDEETFFNKLSEKYTRIREFYIYNNFKIHEKINSPHFPVFFLKGKEISVKSCGFISDYFFYPNLKTFSESLHHNSCLHKKIAIDIDGNIKNCPSMPQSFGNIKDTTLEEALNHKDFKKYWNLTKDSIEVCKDCEFRYICTDCRAYTERTHENKEGLDTSKPLKCGYNPYTAEWQEWSKNPLKEKAINFYGMQELVKKDAH